MNRYDEKYIIRLANKQDIVNIMNFIKCQWREDHLLAIDKEFFCYEYLMGEDVNFMLAIDIETKEIEGILGFIKSSLDLECNDIWGSMWFVKETKENIPFLGVEIFKRLLETTKCRSESGLGLRPQTAVPLLKRLLKNRVGKLKHYYQLANLENYKIAIVNDRSKITENKKTQIKSRILKFNNIGEVKQKYDLSKNRRQIPYKDSWYINKKYFSHPIYKYMVWGVTKNNEDIDALLVGRENVVDGNKVLRIIDYIGNKELISGLRGELKELIEQNNYEYIDFYCYGFDDSILNEAGFVLRDEQDVNVIPNYLAPFVQVNMDIWFNSTEEDVTICMGDADNDRPYLR